MRESETDAADNKRIQHTLLSYLIMPKAGRRRKKTRTHVAEDETTQSALSSAEALKVPKSLVVSIVAPRAHEKIACLSRLCSLISHSLAPTSIDSSR